MPFEKAALSSPNAISKIIPIFVCLIASSDYGVGIHQIKLVFINI